MCIRVIDQNLSTEVSAEGRKREDASVVLKCPTPTSRRIIVAKASYVEKSDNVDFRDLC